MAQPGPSDDPLRGSSSSDICTRSKRRIQLEHKELMESPEIPFSAGPRDDDLYEWVAAVPGPEDTPYAGGVFFLVMRFPKDYPFAPPTVTFRTRVYHCNINSAGKVCIDSLTSAWTPTLTAAHILGAIRGLLAEPNPHDPLVGAIAAQYLTDRAGHDAVAADWTARYAS